MFRGPCGSLQCVDGSDDACGQFSAIDFETQPGEEISIFVHGWAGAAGSFEVALLDSTEPPTPVPTQSPPPTCATAFAFSFGDVLEFAAGFLGL